MGAFLRSERHQVLLLSSLRMTIVRGDTLSADYWELTTANWLLKSETGSGCLAISPLSPIRFAIEGSLRELIADNINTK
jgi:hypothetical protein